MSVEEKVLKLLAWKKEMNLITNWKLRLWKAKKQYEDRKIQVEKINWTNIDFRRSHLKSEMSYRNKLRHWRLNTDRHWTEVAGLYLI